MLSSSVSGAPRSCVSPICWVWESASVMGPFYMEQSSTLTPARCPVGWNAHQCTSMEWDIIRIPSVVHLTTFVDFHSIVTLGGAVLLKRTFGLEKLQWQWFDLAIFHPDSYRLDPWIISISNKYTINIVRVILSVGIGIESRLCVPCNISFDGVLGLCLCLFLTQSRFFNWCQTWGVCFIGCPSKSSVIIIGRWKKSGNGLNSDLDAIRRDGVLEKTK